MRRVIEDIMYGRRNDLFTLPLRAILGLLEAVYGAGVSVRNWLYRRGALTVKSMPCRVVSIGNITVGGTGKTPAAIMTARLLRDAGFKTAVVSRGYGGSMTEPVVVSDGSGPLVTPDVSGDEPHIIARECRDVPVVTAKDRTAGAALAVKTFSPQIIVLDDAFQHRRLHRDVDIVTVDAVNPYGSEHLLPRGILREPPVALRRAHAVLLTRVGDDQMRERTQRMVKYYAGDIPIFVSRHIPAGLRRAGEQERFGTGKLEGASVAALSNIASPEPFHDMLIELGANIVHRRVSPDHHRHTAAEMAAFDSEAAEAGATMIVMTAKDERNLPADTGGSHVQRLVLDIELTLLDDPDRYLDIIAPPG
jgi:tetraacyldisaccharide 4'-kinase